MNYDYTMAIKQTIGHILCLYYESNYIKLTSILNMTSGIIFIHQLIFNCPWTMLKPNG